jgi:hypothetical protein
MKGFERISCCSSPDSYREVEHFKPLKLEVSAVECSLNNGMKGFERISCCSSVVEHFLGKEEVGSSILLNSSIGGSPGFNIKYKKSKINNYGKRKI